MLKYNCLRPLYSEFHNFIFVEDMMITMAAAAAAETDMVEVIAGKNERI